MCQEPQARAVRNARRITVAGGGENPFTIRLRCTWIDGDNTVLDNADGLNFFPVKASV